MIGREGGLIMSRNFPCIFRLSASSSTVFYSLEQKCDTMSEDLVMLAELVRVVATLAILRKRKADSEF